MLRPSPLTDVTLPGSSLVCVVSASPSVRCPSGVRTTPPCSMTSARIVRSPKAEYGTAGVVPVPSMRSLVSGRYLPSRPMPADTSATTPVAG